MTDYPLELVHAYRTKKINRQTYIALLTDWQKKHGMDFTATGTGDDNGVYVTYRGQTGKIDKGMIELNGHLFYTLFHFERWVDAYLNKINLKAKNILRGCYEF